MSEQQERGSLEEALTRVRRLPLVDKVRLIEQIAPEIEREIATSQRTPRQSQFGLLKDLGPGPSEEEIDEARREAWSLFPRDDV